MIAYLPFLLIAVVLCVGAYIFAATARYLWPDRGWRRSVAVVLAFLALLMVLVVVVVAGYEIYYTITYR